LDSRAVTTCRQVSSWLTPNVLYSMSGRRQRACTRMGVRGSMPPRLNMEEARDDMAVKVDAEEDMACPDMDDMVNVDMDERLMSNTLGDLAGDEDTLL